MTSSHARPILISLKQTNSLDVKNFPGLAPAGPVVPCSPASASASRSVAGSSKEADESFVDPNANRARHLFIVRFHRVREVAG